MRADRATRSDPDTHADSGSDPNADGAPRDAHADACAYAHAHADRGTLWLAEPSVLRAAALALGLTSMRTIVAHRWLAGRTLLVALALTTAPPLASGVRAQTGPPFPNFECYRLGRHSGNTTAGRALLDLLPLPGSGVGFERGCRIQQSEPPELCIPVAMSPGGSSAGEDLFNDVLCYHMQCDREANVALTVDTPLFDGRIVVLRDTVRRRVCVPARKTGYPPRPTPTPGPTSTPVPTATPVPTGTPVPTPTPTPPPYGSPSQAFLQAVSSLLD